VTPLQPSRPITHTSRTPWCSREQTELQNGSRFPTATGGRSFPQTRHRPSLRTLGSLSPRSRRGARRLTQESLLAARGLLRPLRLRRRLLVSLRHGLLTLLTSHVQPPSSARSSVAAEPRSSSTRRASAPASARPGSRTALMSSVHDDSSLSCEQLYGLRGNMRSRPPRSQGRKQFKS
jgi:hypothetical protein